MILESLLRRESKPKPVQIDVTSEQIATTKLVMEGAKFFKTLDPTQQVLIEQYFAESTLEKLLVIIDQHLISIAAALDFDAKIHGKETDYRAWITDQLNRRDHTRNETNITS